MPRGTQGCNFHLPTSPVLRCATDFCPAGQPLLPGFFFHHFSPCGFRSSHFSLPFKLPSPKCSHHSSPFWAHGQSNFILYHWTSLRLLLWKLCHFVCVAATKFLESVSGMFLLLSLSFHASHPYNRIGHTEVLHSLIFVFWPMVGVFQIFFRLKTAPCAFLRRFLMSSMSPPSYVTVAPRYTNSSASSTSPLPIITLSSLCIFILITLPFWAFCRWSALLWQEGLSDLMIPRGMLAGALCSWQI